MNKKRIIDISIVVFLIVAGLVFSLTFNNEPEPLKFDASKGVSVISPPIPLPKLSFTDQSGAPFNLEQLKGRWSMVFFGFTHCPDICPTTLTHLGNTAKNIPTTEANYLFVTLDPKRDTPEILNKYVTYFNPDFKALVGDKTAIDKLTETVGVIYDFEGDTSGDEYIVNHYSAILVIDTEARLRAHILPPHSTTKLTDSFNRIRDYYGR
ncbi:SCO family protein [Pseudomonadota bacterium]